jgi:hypothetical protein
MRFASPGSEASLTCRRKNNMDLTSPRCRAVVTSTRPCLASLSPHKLHGLQASTQGLFTPKRFHSCIDFCSGSFATAKADKHVTEISCFNWEGVENCKRQNYGLEQ